MIKSQFVTEETVKEIYKIKNDKCPICEKKFKYLTDIIKIDGKGYHLSCYNKITK